LVNFGGNGFDFIGRELVDGCHLASPCEVEQ
jgi:hypothetical protein